MLKTIKRSSDGSFLYSFFLVRPCTIEYLLTLVNSTSLGSALHHCTFDITLKGNEMFEYKIVKLGNPSLRQISEPISENEFGSKDLRNIVNILFFSLKKEAQ